MTTYYVHYVITDREVPIYHRMLENWASIATGKSLKTVEHLIHNTCDTTGEPSTLIKESLRIESILPFWDVMTDELERMMTIQEKNRKLPHDEFDPTIYQQIELLQTVLEKVTGNAFARYR